MSDSDKLWDELCCCGDDHTVRQGGSHINLVQLKKLAKWPYMTSMNFLVPKSADYPLANAVVCDRCLNEKREIKYAVGGRDNGDGHAEYFRIPMDELEEPEFYWPDHHPDRKPLRDYTLKVNAFEAGVLMSMIDIAGEAFKTPLASVWRQLVDIKREIEKADGVTKKLLPDGQLEIIDVDGNRFVRPPMSWEIDGN